MFVEDQSVTDVMWQVDRASSIIGEPGSGVCCWFRGAAMGCFASHEVVSASMLQVSGKFGQEDRRHSNRE